MSDQEQRAADQDTAIEQAFVAGTLPEEDRRVDEASVTALAAEIETLKAELAAAKAVPVVEAKPSEDPSVAAIAAAGVGSIFEKTAIGWNVKYVDGGTIIHVQGATIADAIASHGGQVEHPKSRDELAREAAVALTVQ